jgi:hypothetical protein
MPTPTRVRPVASIDVFNVAHGDPILTDRGFSRLDILKKENNEKSYQGTPDCFPNGAPKLQFLDDIGLTLRGYINPVDMRLSQHLCTPSGSWDELQSVGGSKNVFHLRYSDTLGAAFTCLSNYNLSANPVFAVSLIIPETTNTWNFTTSEPFIRIEFGNGKWAVLLSKQNGNVLLANVAGQWVVAADLQEGRGGAARAITDEKWVIIRCEFGGIFISFDMGHSWTPYFTPDQTPVVVPAGPWRIVGQGSAPVIGLGEYQVVAAAYDSPAWDSFDVRSSLSTAIITGHGYLPAAGGSISFFDISVPSSRQAQYRAALIPTQTMVFPFRMWNTPALQNVTLRYAFQRATTSGTFTNAWDPFIVEIGITQPEKLAEGSCNIVLTGDAHTAYDFTGMRDRKVRVHLGYLMSDGTKEYETVFTGYVSNEVKLDVNSWGEKYIHISLVNIAGLFAKKPWDPLHGGSFAGMTPQAAGDFILMSEGFMDEAAIDRTYATWFTASLGTAPLPLGEWHHPFETIKPQESKFKTLERIFDYYGFEIGVTNDGGFISLPKNYISPTASWTLYAGDDLMMDDVRKQITNASYTYNIKDSATAVMVYGTLSNGLTAVVYAIDDPAETDTSVERFTPNRQWILEEFSGAHGKPDENLMLEKLFNLSRDNLGLKKEPNISFPVHIQRNRRDKIIVNGCAGIGIPDGTEFTLMSQSITYKANQGLGEIQSSCNLRQLINQGS